MNALSRKERKRRAGLSGILIFLVLLLAGAAAGGAADGLVVCRALQAQGAAIRLVLGIGSPAPAHVIVSLQLPPGTALQQATPPVSRFDPRSGEVKWLLKDPQPGELPLAVELSRPLGASALAGEIRYKHPLTGAMVVEVLAGP